MKTYYLKNLTLIQTESYIEFLDCYQDVILTKKISSLTKQNVDIFNIAQIISMLETLCVEYEDKPSDKVLNENIRYEIENSLTPIQYVNCKKIVQEIYTNYRNKNNIYNSFKSILASYIKNEKNKNDNLTLNN